VTRALLNPQSREHLVKLLGYLGSSHDGERAAAALKCHEFVRRQQLTWSDVIRDPPDSWRRMASACLKQQGLLNVRERDFINNVVRLRWPPSDAQLQWLEAIYRRLHGQEVA
jgi:hypothetical protein